MTQEYKETLGNMFKHFVLGETIISDSDKIKNLVENFKKIRRRRSKSLIWRRRRTY